VPARSLLARVRGDVEVVDWDLLREEPLPAGLLDGVSTVIHAAAFASSVPDDESKMRAVNVDATLRLFDRAEAAGVCSWVQISSVATLSGGDADVVTEDRGSPRPTPYARTKRAADDLLSTRTGRIAVLTIHPTFMLGPWDARPSSGAVLLALRLRRLKHYVDVVKNVADAGDVARGIWRALDARATGHYLLGGIDVTLETFFHEAASRLGVQPPVRLPALPAAPSGDVDARELDILRELCTPSPTSSAKAARDFGYRPDVELGPLLDRTIAYFTEHRLMLARRTAKVNP
jgi:nucleoside-diphosphate-sugar epimerase